MTSRIPIIISLIIIFVSFVCPIRGEELSPERFRRMVVNQLEKEGNPSDSVGAAIRVHDFSEARRDFLLIPVIREGKLIAVYRDDPKRNNVALIASRAVLRSTRPDLFSLEGARKELAERGFGGSEPFLLSFGPFSLFGVLEAGWYAGVGDSFMLLSFEGKLVSEKDATRLWRIKPEIVKQVKDRLSSKE